jgi:two-component system NarL family response regulator
MPPAPVLRVLLTHPSAIVREGTRHILEEEHDFEIVGESPSIALAASQVEALQPDVLLLGLGPDELESRSYVRALRGVLANARVLVLEHGVPPPHLARIGINAWLAANASPVELVTALRAAAGGRPVSGNPTTIGQAEHAVGMHPTPRELEVLALIEEGLTTRAIAEHLRTTPRTVHFHVGNLFAKLGASSRTEMVHLARRRGWLE